MVNNLPEDDKATQHICSAFLWSAALKTTQQLKRSFQLIHRNPERNTKIQ